MKYTIEAVSNKTFEDKQTKQKTILPGFSFIDEFGHCIIIVYGIFNYNKTIKQLS